MWITHYYFELGTQSQFHHYIATFQTLSCVQTLLTSFQAWFDFAVLQIQDSHFLFLPLFLPNNLANYSFCFLFFYIFSHMLSLEVRSLLSNLKLSHFGCWALRFLPLMKLGTFLMFVSFFLRRHYHLQVLHLI